MVFLTGACVSTQLRLRYDAATLAALTLIAMIIAVTRFRRTMD